MQDRREIGPLDLQPNRPHELQHLDNDGVRQLGLAHDVGEQRLCLFRVGHLPPQQPGHHLDASERVLQFVGDARRHFTERGEAIPQPLSLFQLFDLRQVFEEHHGADWRARFVLHLRQRVADHPVQIAQPELGAIGQVTQFEGAREHADDVRTLPENVGKRPPNI